jgi:hypothetical protein
MTILWPETTPIAQATTTTPSWQVAPQHEPPLEEKSILMIDYVPVQARGKGEELTASREGGLAAAKALNTSPPPTADGVDKMYHQLAEIYAITATQLAECALWCRSNSTPSPVWARTGR